MDRRSFLRSSALAVGAPHLGQVLQPEPMTGSRQDPCPPAPATTRSRSHRGKEK